MTRENGASESVEGISGEGRSGDGGGVVGEGGEHGEGGSGDGGEGVSGDAAAAVAASIDEAPPTTQQSSKVTWQSLELERRRFNFDLIPKVRPLHITSD